MSLYLEPVQARQGPVSSYERTLSRAIEQCFADGAESPDEMAAGLNQQNIPGPGGEPWSADSFIAEMSRLGE